MKSIKIQKLQEQILTVKPTLPPPWYSTLTKYSYAIYRPYLVHPLRLIYTDLNTIEPKSNKPSKTLQDINQLFNHILGKLA